MATDPARPAPQAGPDQANPVQADPAGADLAVQRLAASGLRVFAVTVVLAGLAASVLFWLVVFRSPGPLHWLRDALAAGIALQLLFLATLAAWAVLVWRRAARIGALDAPDYPVVSCVAACIRLLGELGAVAVLAVSLGLAVATLAGQPLVAGPIADWLGGEGALPPWAVPALTLMLALVWPLAGGVFAGGILFAAYLAAELMSLMLDYVRDVRRIREAAESAPEKEPRSSGRPSD